MIKGTLIGTPNQQIGPQCFTAPVKRQTMDQLANKAERFQGKDEKQTKEGEVYETLRGGGAHEKNEGDI